MKPLSDEQRNNLKPFFDRVFAVMEPKEQPVDAFERVIAALGRILRGDPVLEMTLAADVEQLSQDSAAWAEAVAQSALDDLGDSQPERRARIEWIITELLRPRTTDEARRRARRATPTFLGERFQTITGTDRRAISSFITARDVERQDTETGVAVQHVERDRIAHVEMRAGETPDHAEIRTVAAQLGGIDEDVLDVLIANALHRGPDADGLYEIGVDDVIATRQRGVKKQRSGEGKVYRAGVRDEARADVVDALDALDHLYIATGEPRKVRGKVVRDFDRIFNVQRKTFEHADGSGDLISVRYGFGPWFELWRHNRVLVPKRLIELDGRGGAQEKNLGRYFVHLADEGGHAGRIRRTVRQIFDELRRPMEDAKNNPARVRNRLEEQLNALKRERIIAGWAYDPEPTLPARGWFEHWLGATIVVELPAGALVGASHSEPPGSAV